MSNGDANAWKEEYFEAAEQAAAQTNSDVEQYNVIVLCMIYFAGVLQSHEIGCVMMKHEHNVRLRLNQKAQSSQSRNHW